MTWLTLLPAALSCLVGAVMTYRREWAGEWWYPVLFGCLSLFNGVMYGLGVRWTRDGAEAFVFSTVWDVTITAVYLAVPLAWCGVRLTPAGWVGVATVCGGLLLLKTIGTRGV